jgi:hypothetical protein
MKFAVRTQTLAALAIAYRCVQLTTFVRAISDFDGVSRSGVCLGSGWNTLGFAMKHFNNASRLPNCRPEST